MDFHITQFLRRALAGENHLKFVLALIASVFRLCCTGSNGWMDLFWRGGAEPPPRGTAVLLQKQKGQYCCFAVWTLDCGPSSIPAVNSIPDFLLSVFLLRRLPSPLPPPASSTSPLPFAEGCREEVEPKCAMSATCFCPPPRSSLRPFSFNFVSAGSISLLFFL